MKNAGSRTNRAKGWRFQDRQGGQARRALSPTQTCIQKWICCQPRVTGLVVKVLFWLVTRLSAQPARVVSILSLS